MILVVGIALALFLLLLWLKEPKDR